MQLLDISAAQQRVLDFYRAYIAEHGRAPMLAEAVKELKVQHTTIVFHLNKLEEHGYIRRRPGTRNVLLTDKAAPAA